MAWGLHNKTRNAETSGTTMPSIRLACQATPSRLLTAATTWPILTMTGEATKLLQAVSSNFSASRTKPQAVTMPKYVYDFAEGNRDMKDLLGGKGANLAEMTNLGLPVPPGFTITTEACQAYLETGHQPDGLAAEIGEHLAALERVMGKQLGQSDDPLLVSVRSGAKFSMPGMMETVLNIGLDDQSVRGLAAQSDSERFAFDSYRRLIQMFGKTVLGIEGDHFAEALDAAKHAKGTTNDLDLDA